MHDSGLGMGLVLAFTYMVYVCIILVVITPGGAVMRAVRQSAWGEAEAMTVVEVEEPVPVFGEVLVRVMAAGVNPVDVFTRRGQAYATSPVCRRVWASPRRRRCRSPG
ncbi:hypothetical protein GCM10010176_007930 [Nonomuraea spiralis]|nr:hypothetical protein GCM10010176_007930 [Nonomuraea spiralis]